MTVGGKPWAEGPFPLISAKHGGFEGIDPHKKRQGLDAIVWDMTAIHNVFLRGINTIYHQAIKVSELGTDADKLEFCEFASVWSLGLHEHHELEEDSFFPDIENVSGEKGIMEANVKQHEAFTSGLAQYDAYLKKVESGEEKYDGKKLVAIIDDFGKVLSEHLSDEILTLKGLNKYPDVDWEAVNKRLGKRVLETVDAPGVKTKWFPYVLSHHHKTFENGELKTFPETPWFIVLILNWFYIPSKKHLWRFSCCDLEGQRKELLFA